MSVLNWFFSVTLFSMGGLLLYGATQDKEELGCSADWIYSLAQLGLVVMAMAYWIMSYFFFAGIWR